MKNRSQELVVLIPTILVLNDHRVEQEISKIGCQKKISI